MLQIKQHFNSASGWSSHSLVFLVAYSQSPPAGSPEGEKVDRNVKESTFYLPCTLSSSGAEFISSPSSPQSLSSTHTRTIPSFHTRRRLLHLKLVILTQAISASPVLASHCVLLLLTLNSMKTVLDLAAESLLSTLSLSLIANQAEEEEEENRLL